MAIKIVSGLVAVILMLVYLGPVIVKLWNPALSIAIIIGIVLMLVDLRQSLKSKSN